MPLKSLSQIRSNPGWVGSLLVGIGVFLLCIFGIATRPHLDLATFWPANAFLLGVLLRFPVLANWRSWAFAAAGFVAADAATGTAILANLCLNGGNLAAIAAGHFFLSRRDTSLSHPASVLNTLLGICIASAVAGLGGMFMNPLLFGGNWRVGFSFWFVTELMNYSAFLPVILTLPDMKAPRARKAAGSRANPDRSEVLPLVVLGASCAGAVLIGGPGAVAFPIPALLWCALSYNLFLTSCLTLAYGIWALASIRTGIIWISPDQATRAFLVSLRLEVTLISLAPILVASVMAARLKLVDQLRTLANLDALTGLRNRRSFLEEGKSVLAAAGPETGRATVMMLDIDHFKLINDNHGHGAGDLVLTAFASTLKSCLRPQDSLGRMGGEEFAIMLPDCSIDVAATIAARINNAVRQSPINLPSGELVHITVSIGIHIDGGTGDLGFLLSQADRALYHAKHSGRDRYVFSSELLRLERPTLRSA